MFLITIIWVYLSEIAGCQKLLALKEKIKDVFFYIDRVDKDVQALKDLGIKSHSVVKFDAVTWDYLYEIEIITDEMYSLLMNHIGNEDSWV
ncbi:MAG: hypothetical protein K0B07_05190 [DPANN group archaeon]|nr:hypothetical protein [DPANN group archaeon]